MKWVIAKNVMCDILAYSGVNCSGKLTFVRIFPSGVQGEELQSQNLSSLMIAAAHGTRVALCTTADEETWKERPWRVIQVLEGHSFTAQNGRPAVRVLDLDQYNEPDALTLPPGVECTFVEYERPEEGSGWTYGRSGDQPLKGHIQMILVDKI